MGHSQISGSLVAGKRWRQQVTWPKKEGVYSTSQRTGPSAPFGRASLVVSLCSAPLSIPTSRGSSQHSQCSLPARVGDPSGLLLPLVMGRSLRLWS